MARHETASHGRTALASGKDLGRQGHLRHRLGGLSYSSGRCLAKVEVGADAVPGRKGVAARALCLGFLVVGMVVGEMAREDDVEVGWENRAR